MSHGRRVPTIHLGIRGHGPEPGGVIRRSAVKALVEVDGGLLLIRSAHDGDYKLPGGGVEPGESDAEALARELDEECGRDIAALGALVLRVVEEHPAREDPACRFVMESRYYACTVTDVRRPPRLTDAERGDGMEQVVVTWSDAVAGNRSVLARAGDHLPWVDRELQVLELLARERGLRLG